MHCDVDMCIILPSITLYRQETSELITTIGKHLEDHTDAVRSVPSARIPIVNFLDKSTKLSCDLCINNTPALWNTAIITYLCKIDYRFKVLATIIRFVITILKLYLKLIIYKMIDNGHVHD